MPYETSEEALASLFERYSKRGPQFTKAINTALEGCVKEHTFLPSGRKVYTVVGRNGDEFVDPEKSVCSCESYFFRVLSGKSNSCYHQLSFQIASESGLLRETKFDDEEYDDFMRLLALDIIEAGRSHKTSTVGRKRR